jgi:outer membrane protein
MKRSLIAFVALTMAFAGTTYAQGQNLKIAVVDMQKVFDGYFKTKDAEEKLKAKAKTYEDELKSRQGEVEKLKEDFNKLLEETKNPALTEEVKKQKQDAAEKKAQEGRMLLNQYGSLGQTRGKELNEQRARVRADIVEDIRKEIEAKSKKESYSLVFDKSGMTSTGLPPLVYSQESFDITADILKILNAKKSGGDKK